MGEAQGTNDKDQLLAGIYRLSWRSSTIALSVVAILEVFMLVYSCVDIPLFGEYIWTYRMFYISLLFVAVVYLALNVFVKKDIEGRHMMLSVANPLCAAFFFIWALGITYFDAVKFGTVDATVFMTFSLTVPLSFFLFPSLYAAIAVVADIAMVYIAVTITGSAAPLINISIFCIFQLVLGINFLRLKMQLTERILEEQKNASIDVLTGFPNRRSYEKDMKAFAEEPMPDDLMYVSVDLNGLKEINDTCGHEAGDKMIIGASQCIDKCFGERGKAYRLGGDEFAVLASAQQDEAEQLLGDYEECMEAWSKSNDMTLTAACGFVRHAEYPEMNVTELARVADERMYTSKARYYQESGRERRRYRAEEHLLADDQQE